jgi:hypothetical protein
MSNLNSFAELMQQAAKEKNIRELAEKTRKETIVAPLLSELFSTIQRGKDSRQEVLTKESPLLEELQIALSDPEKFKLQKEDKKTKVLNFVTELDEKATAIKAKTEDVSVGVNESVTNLEKKFLTIFNRLQNDFQTLKKYVETRPAQSSSVYAGTSGSGEVRVLRMDDVDRSAKPTKGDLLIWSSEKSKFEFTQLDNKQDTLVSGENIKTLNNESLLGASNIIIDGFEIGDIVLSSANKALNPKWLEADGGVYRQLDYPELFGVVGLSRLSPNTKLLTPASIPPGAPTGCSISGDGLYFAVATGAPPFINLYKQTGATYTALAAPTVLPTGAASGCSMSGDGVHLSVTTGAPTYIHNYKRVNDTFTKLAAPSTIPLAAGAASAYSYDGVYMAVSYGAPPYFIIYKIVGDTYTALPAPTVTPPAATSGLAFSKQGEFMVALYGAPPYITIYKNVNGAYQALPAPTVTPTGAPSGASFGANGQFLAVTHAAAPYLTIYKYSGQVFNKISNPAVPPSAAGLGVSFTTDAFYMSVIYGAAPFIDFYKRDNDDFIKMPALDAPPTGAATSFALSGDGNFVGLAAAPPPYISTYKAVAPFNIATEFIVPSIQNANSIKSPLEAKHYIKAIL